MLSKELSKEEWIKRASVYLIVVSILVMIVAIMMLGEDMTNKSFFGLGMFGAGILFVLSLPGAIVGACDMKYVEKGTKGWLGVSTMLGWITAAIYGWLIFTIDPIGSGTAWFAIPLIVVAMVLPISLFLIGCHRK